MKSRWKTYMQYASLILIGGSLLYFLVATIQAKNTGFETKTLWDWMELLIIPLVLAVGAFLLNRSEKEIERKQAADRVRSEHDAIRSRQQEMAFQTFLDRMSELLLSEKLRTSPTKDVQDVARARTLSTLRQLDAGHNDLLLRFLQDVGLIKNAYVNLEGADLKGAYLTGVDLSGAKLNGANLNQARMSNANLSEAILHDADMWMAELDGANLRGAYLINTDLSNAYLVGADLSGTNLSRANLMGAKVSDEQLATANSLEGTTMPDGTVHE